MINAQPIPRTNPATILSPNNRKERRARKAEIRRFLKSEKKPMLATKSEGVNH